MQHPSCVPTIRGVHFRLLDPAAQAAVVVEPRSAAAVVDERLAQRHGWVDLFRARYGG